MIDEVVDTIGIQIYQYLHPKDLFFLSICNHKLYNDIVHKKLAEICISHLPLHLGAGTNYLGTFREGTSFGSKEELLEFVLDKTEEADLLLQGTTTVEESRRLAREKILDYTATPGYSPHWCFYPRGTSSSKGGVVRRIDISAIGIPPPMTLPTTIDCHYDWEGVGNRVASNWVDQIMNRSTFRKDKETHALIKSWLNFLFAIQITNRHESNIWFGTWRWSCKHSKLNGQGIAGSGVMISIQQQRNSRKIVEISFTRSY